MGDSSDIKKNLQSYGIKDFYINLLEKSNLLSTQSLFYLPISTISFRTSIPLSICEQILTILAEAIIPKPIIFETTKKIPIFDDPILDNRIYFPENGIIEICGLAGSGKSNICFHIACKRFQKFPNQKIIYISTEGKIPIERINQIGNFIGINNISDNFLLYNVNEINELSKIIHLNLPELFKENSNFNPSLIIIDSIASLFRIEIDTSNVSSLLLRTRILFDFSSTLKWLSYQYSCPIIITNQATANFNHFTNFNQDWTPSLGLSWSNCINIRFIISKTNMKREIINSIITNNNENIIESTENVIIRNINVEISPRQENLKCNFYINNSGIHGI